MAEFNLQKMLDGAKVQTIDGREVVIAGYYENAESFEKILGWINDPEGVYSQSWFNYGKTISDKESNDDLVLVD